MGTLGKRWGTPASERFWPMVNKNGPILDAALGACWEWVGSINRGGYGSFRWESHGRIIGAHQASWRLAHGTIPEGHCVLHKCDNRKCVRPSHLWTGSKTENNVDRDRKGRQRGPRGEAARSAKLTESQVKEIRMLCSTGVTNVSIADRFGVDKSLIGLIARRAIWKHVS